jgi:hypothetical protein
MLNCWKIIGGDNGLLQDVCIDFLGFSLLGNRGLGQHAFPECSLKLAASVIQSVHHAIAHLIGYAGL